MHVVIDEITSNLPTFARFGSDHKIEPHIFSGQSEKSKLLMYMYVQEFAGVYYYRIVFLHNAEIHSLDINLSNAGSSSIWQHHFI